MVRVMFRAGVSVQVSARVRWLNAGSVTPNIRALEYEIVVYRGGHLRLNYFTCASSCGAIMCKQLR